jgi:hypothetical protein
MARLVEQTEDESRIEALEEIVHERDAESHSAH